MKTAPLHILRMRDLSDPLAGLARPLSWFAGVVLLVLGLPGCAPPKPIKYYQVTYPTKAYIADDAIKASLLVRPFEGSHLYLDDKMVYGFDSPEMGTYEYQRWSEPPVEILQNALVRGLRSSGRFTAVYSMRADPNGRFILAGQLYDFKEVDAASVVARLSYEVRLRDRKTGTTVWEHSYSYDEPATEKSVPAFVVAMDKNLQRSVQEVQTGLEAYFRAHPVQ
jgi:ABC-type uncharacterized transport system auxiliary subunit